MTLDNIQHTTEFQIFDRKSAKIDAKGLAVILIAFANADGGTVALGVEDDGKVTGVDGMQSHINDLLRASFDYCVPSIHTSPEYMEVTDYKAQPNHIILMRVAPSTKVHANQADEVFYRVGDKSKKLNFEQRTHLMYAKGERLFEDAPVQNAKMDDLDMALVEGYLKKIDYQKGAEAFIRENDFLTQIEDFRGGTKEYLTGAAVLLFGKNPQKFFPRARIRVIRYEGTEAKVGREMNVIKDEIFTGAILDMTNKALAFIKTQVKEHTYLGPDGLFRTDPQYPEFCWTEQCVNSVAHRSYEILGTDIQVKIFDDHITVESPGIFPGLVRASNIRHTHFSRNPKIAGYLHAYKLVKEFGEGVDRMYREMEEAGCPAPEFKQQDFMVYATIRQHRDAIATEKTTEKSEELNLNGKELARSWQGVGKELGVDFRILERIGLFCTEARSLGDIAEHVGLADRYKMKKKYIDPVLGIYLEMTLPDTPNNPAQQYVLTDAGRELQAD